MSTYTLFNAYVGSKAPYVSKIKSLFDPTCTKYFEPFAGGAAVYFSHYNGKYQKEGLNDMNSNIALLYKALADDETRDDVVKAILNIEKPDDVTKAKVQFESAKSNMLSNKIRIQRIPKERWCELCRNAFLVYSQSFNNAGKTYSSLKSNEKYHYETMRNLESVVERLSTHPQVSQLDGNGWIKYLSDKEETQLLIDWPYVGQYRSCSKLYGCEMSGLYEHIIGAQALANCKAAVVMCDYRSAIPEIPTVYDAYLGGEWHCFKLQDTYKKCQVVKHGECKQKAQEYVWTNRIPEFAGNYISLTDYKEKIEVDEYWFKIRKACLEKKISNKFIHEYEMTYKHLYGKDLLL